MTKRSYTWTLLSLSLACSTAEASPELLRASIGTAVAALAASDNVASLAPGNTAPQPDVDGVYLGLRRTYLPRDMRLHACARVADDGSVVGRDCPAGVVIWGPRAVAPTHSDVQVRFDIESTGDVEVASDIVSDAARRVHGRLDQQSLAAREKRTISYAVHVFEAAPAVEARVAVRGRSHIDFRISGLEVEVR